MMGCWKVPLHGTNIVGLPFQALGFVTGIGIATMSMTGVVT